MREPRPADDRQLPPLDKISAIIQALVYDSMLKQFNVIQN